MDKVVDVINVNRDRYVEELKDYLAIPSISALPQHAADVRKGAGWTANQMRESGLDNVRLEETPGHPVVYGEWLGAESAPTILFYGHYDVQPVDPVNLWTSPPFEATVRDGEIYARGSADDKGNLYVAESGMGTSGAKAPPRIYVPNRRSNDVSVIDPATMKVIDRFTVGVHPQHVVPSWDLRTLWVTNNAEKRFDGSLTPIDPMTGKPGKPIDVDNPYNMYFTPDGRSAMPRRPSCWRTRPIPWSRPRRKSRPSSRTRMLRPSSSRTWPWPMAVCWPSAGYLNRALTRSIRPASARWR